MTRGELEISTGPGRAPANREAKPGPSASTLVLTALGVIATLALAGRAHAAKTDMLPDGVITEIRVEGNVSIPPDQIRAKLLTRPGDPLEQRRITADLRTLMGTHWFSHVQPYYDRDPKVPKGFVLIFSVKEMPVLTHVEFRNRKNVKLKDIEETTGLKAGARADAMRARLAVGQIKRLYEEKGYDYAEVRLVEGGQTGDTRVVFEIFEGPYHKVSSVDFVGNSFATDGTLMTKITSKRKFLGLLPSKYHADMLDEDVRKLKEYYQGQGFFEVKVSTVTRPATDLGQTNLTFVISEGVRYKVRNISFEGNKQVSSAKLRDGLMMHSGQPVLETLKEADRKRLLTKYYELGFIEAQILGEPKATDQPGVVDVTYRIEEGQPYLLGELQIFGNERTKDKVIRREAAMAGLLPGEILNKNNFDLFKQRLGNTQFFVMQPDQTGNGKPIELKIVRPRPHDQPYGDNLPMLGDDTLTRGQDPDPPPAADSPPDPGPGPALPSTPAIQVPPAGGPSVAPFGGGGAPLFGPPPDTVPPISVPSAPPLPNALPPGTAPRTPPVGSGEPPGEFPSVPGMNMTDVGPDRQDPFPNRRFADVVTALEEAPTGRFMVGVGASGAQGLNGNVTITERNFDLFNLPSSWEDIYSGRAFRGAGQDFQVSAMAGTLINRFTVSLGNPYLFDLPIGGKATGYLFQRIYPNWTEARGGGRFSIGRQLGPQIYADLAFRIEDVNFYGYRWPAPADYLAAAGHSTLASIRPSIRFDNRNSPFAPNKGQYLEFSFEQGWGTFTFPKVEIEGRKYFTLGSRPDGSGSRILTFRGHFGVTGRDTPVYERFYAGYIGSLRGFNYRGVGPHVLGVNVGGFMEAIGSVEYMFPLTASDTIRQVVFTDFGTVQNNYDFENFRVSVGTGIRLTLPQLGPMPLAFDLAFPVVKAPGDQVNYFNFSIGAFY